MGKSLFQFKSVRLSLADILGKDYASAVCAARTAVSGEALDRLLDVAVKRVDFFPARLRQHLTSLLPLTGSIVSRVLSAPAAGASTAAFNAVDRHAAAPLAGFGYFRVGEDGRLYLVSKSEHYHASLGHSFPGYRLVDFARRLGIPNATHNNTRGFITKTLEEDLVRAAGGGTPGALDRVLNLETGSLAVEAAFKMILARFYKSQDDTGEPRYGGRVPVFVVVGNDDGGLQANYHGTTVLCQALRGMWPQFESVLETAGALRIRSVRPNNIDDLRRVLAENDSGRYKVAAFFHEIVMMNYGGRLLSPEFLREAYQICAERDIATVDDEIQSCLWHPDLFMFREWGLSPSFVAVGKGFPGGEYPASRILFNSQFDTLPQFGALVTNGQEELASLAYLITIAWARANSDVTRYIGDYFQERMREVAAAHKGLIASIDGSRHLLGISFAGLAEAKAVASYLNDRGLDISVQSYKANCPPSALLKLPIIMGREAVDFVVNRFDEAVTKVEASHGAKAAK